MVILIPMMDGYHNSSGYTYGSLVLPEVPQAMQLQPSADLPNSVPTELHPSLQRALLPADIIYELVSCTKPKVKVTNSNP